ncbi:MAG: SDR family oxidoreductase, partial [Tumebacillaceae bacterium]
DPKRVLGSELAMRERPVAFLFTGVGDQYVNMARELYRSEAFFKKMVDRCCDVLQPQLGLDLRDVLFNEEKVAESGGFDLRKMLRRDVETDPATAKLNETIYAQPAMFVVEYALARLLIKWGIKPQAMIGHSLGEYVAACLAGVFSLEDALVLVAKRAQLINALPGGSMLAVPMSEQEVAPLLGEGLFLATVNAPAHCVVSGTTEAINELEAKLKEQGVACSRVQTTHAFHSPMMEPIRESFVELVGSFTRKAPKVPFVSNVTGTWVKAEEVTDPTYWGKHLCQTVRFADGVRVLSEDTNLLYLEVGPGQTLSSFALQNKSDAASKRVVLPTLRPSYDNRSDLAFLLNTMGQMWLEGVEIDWKKYYGEERRQRVPLPTYPFERQRFWIDAPKQGAVAMTAQASGLESAATPTKLDVSEWFQTPSWKLSLPLAKAGVAPSAEEEPLNWLVFQDDAGLGEQLVQRLREQGHRVVQVVQGESFAVDENNYSVNPASYAGYEALVSALMEQELLPQRIVHLWSVTDQELLGGQMSFEASQEVGYYSLLHLAKALGKLHVVDPLDLWVVADHLHEIESTDTRAPEKATLLAPCKVIPQEYANITCRLVDVKLPNLSTRGGQQVVGHLLNEFATRASDRVISYRGQHRWVQTYEPLALAPATERPQRLRDKGVYLITGGLGWFGGLHAEYLAKTVQAKLVLIGREGLPDRAEWTQYLAAHEADDRVSKRIRNVQELEAFGAEVLVVAADVADEAQMQAALEAAQERFGALHGVIHAAGLVEQDAHTTIAETGVAESEHHFQARVHGSYVLDQVLQGHTLDFCLFVSSLSNVLGGIGLVTSTAAHLFMDAFVQHQHNAGHMPWITVNWEPGTPEEMFDAIGRVFAMEPVVPLVVSTRELTGRIKQWVEFAASASAGASQTAGAKPGQGHARPNLHNAYVAPRDESEEAIAEIFQELLGIEPIGIHDNFFQLGGNSLIGTQLVTRLRSAFQVDLPLRILFETSTVAELSVTIEEILINEILNMSEDEIEAGLL